MQAWRGDDRQQTVNFKPLIFSEIHAAGDMDHLVAGFRQSPASNDAPYAQVHGRSHLADDPEGGLQIADPKSAASSASLAALVVR